MAKTWFITDASSGLGREMTQQLLDRGDRVVATVRQETALADLQQSYPEALVSMILDVTDVDGLHRTVDDAFARMGRIDIVVSNAGYGLFGAAEEVTDAQIDHQLATNLAGSIRLIRATLPHLRRQGGGRIVQVSSEGGQIAYPGFSLYHATKWGIEGFVEAVAQEVAPFGIDFIIAEPGPTVTNFAGGLVRPTPMDAYLQTPAGDVRRMIDDGRFVLKGDGPRTAAAIIAAADSPNPALRLALGSTAYASISKALAQRLKAIEVQRAIAFSADRDDL